MNVILNGRKHLMNANPNECDMKPLFTYGGPVSNKNYCYQW